MRGRGETSEQTTTPAGREVDGLDTGAVAVVTMAGGVGRAAATAIPRSGQCAPRPRLIVRPCGYLENFSSRPPSRADHLAGGTVPAAVLRGGGCVHTPTLRGPSSPVTLRKRGAWGPHEPATPGSSGGPRRERPSEGGRSEGTQEGLLEAASHAGLSSARPPPLRGAHPPTHRSSVGFAAVLSLFVIGIVQGLQPLLSV